MAELLVQLVNVREGHVAGEVITIKPNGFIWPDQSRRLFPIVKCTELGVAAAKKIYLKNGVPDAVSLAVSNADLSLSAAIASGDLETITAAKAAAQLALKEADPTTWPPKLYVLDTSQIPLITKNRILETWQVRSQVRVDAERAAHNRFIGFLDRSPLGPLTAEEKSRSVHQWQELLDRRLQRAKADGVSFKELGRIRDLIDKIADESRLGFRSVEDPALTTLAIPAAISVSLATLQAITIKLDADAYHALRQ